MYEFINGEVCELTPAFVVIQTCGVGYHINISLHTFTQVTNSFHNSTSKNLKCFLHHVVREDAQLLFGFFDAHERDLFRHLISVSGIGANTARMMLSSMNPSELQNAISEGNVNLLKGVKGIGLKTAQRIIIDLKDKIGATANFNEKFLQSHNTIKDEALSALVTLGFSKAMVDKGIDKLLASKPDMTVEDVIKQVLKGV